MKRNRKEQSDFVIGSIKGLGLNPNPSSRLIKMYRLLNSGVDYFKPDHPEFENVLESQRDFQIFEFIVDYLNTIQEGKEYFTKFVKKSLNDSVLPQDDLGNTEGRDTQFELFVSTVCRKAKLFPVELDEPDVTCYVNEQNYGIAAKRIKSLNNFENNIRKASDQIEKSKLPGIIAIDTNVLLNPKNKRIEEVLTEEEFKKLSLLAMNRIIRKYHDKMQEWVRRKGVRGIVIHELHPRNLGNDWELAGINIWINTARVNQRRNRESVQFWNSYKKGLPNNTDLSTKV